MEKQNSETPVTNMLHIEARHTVEEQHPEALVPDEATAGAVD